MFNALSNMAFNNKVFSGRTILPMHETMSRLFSAAQVEGPSELAEILNESPQTITNWCSRGLSLPGALKAEEILHCSAVWLLKGIEVVLRPAANATAGTGYGGAKVMQFNTVGEAAVAYGAAWPFETITSAQWNSIEPAQRRKAERMLNAFLDDGSENRIDQTAQG